MSSAITKTLLLLAALLIVLLVTACAGSLTSAEDSLPALPGESIAAETAPGFTLPSGLEGQVSQGSYAEERNVVLVFYRGFW